jgi:hypothetical protein
MGDSQEVRGSGVVGVNSGYNDFELKAFRTVSSPMAGLSPPPDENVWCWLEALVSSRPTPLRVIDWGAGLGRFVPLYRRLKPSAVFLVEPNRMAVQELREKYSDDDSIRLLLSPLVASLDDIHRVDGQTYHFCIFVLNCIRDLADAFRNLISNSSSSDRLFIFTSVFVSRDLAERMGTDPVRYHLAIDLALEAQVGSFAKAAEDGTKFRVRVKGTPVEFVDHFRVLSDFSRVLFQSGLPLRVVDSRLFHPCGFEAVPGQEQAGGNVFKVLFLELERT